MNTKKLKLISLLEETNKSVKDNGSSILVEGLTPSEAEKIRQSFYKDGLDITPQEDGSFEFSFNTTESGSDDDIYNMFRDNDYDLEADYDEEDAILNANDECNGEICSSEDSDDISGILSVCTDYQVEPEYIDLYSDDADKLVDYSINYDVCPEEICGAENSVENTEELEQPVAVEQDYYFDNDFSGVDAGVIGFEEKPEADMGIINLADDHSAEDYDEEAIDPALIDNIEKENNRDIKDYLTVESVEEDEKLSDENIEPALKKLLIHNKEVLFGADSKKLSDYKAKIEKLDIEKLKDFADEDMPTWRKHIEKYIGSEELNESDDSYNGLEVGEDYVAEDGTKIHIGDSFHNGNKFIYVGYYKDGDSTKVVKYNQDGSIRLGADNKKTIKINESFAHAIMDTPAWRRRKVYPNDIYVISRDIWHIVAHRTPHIDFASDDEPKLSEIDGGYKIQYKFAEPNQEMIEQLSMDIKHFLDGDKSQSENSTCYLGKSFNVLTRANKILTIMITLDDKKPLDESSDKIIYKIETDGKYLKKTFTDHDKAYDYACEYLSKHEKDNIDHVAVEEFVNGEYNDDIVVMFKEPELNENKKISEATKPSNNEAWGYHGVLLNMAENGEIEGIDRIWDETFSALEKEGYDEDFVQKFLDSRMGRHFGDTFYNEIKEGKIAETIHQKIKEIKEKFISWFLRTEVNTINESVTLNESWGDFDIFSDRLEKYLPPTGEGETKASQYATALSKLVYRWFNDGDVYDNNYGMEGFGNDLSPYANWLYEHIDGAEVLKRIEKIGNDESRYENILLDLCSLTCTEDRLEKLAQEPKEGSIYKCDGPFSLGEHYHCPQCGAEVDSWNTLCDDCWEEQNEEDEDLDESVESSPKGLKAIKDYIIDHFGDNMEFDTIETNKIYFNHVSYNTNQFSIEKMEEMLMDNFKGYGFEIEKDGEIGDQGEVLHVIVTDYHKNPSDESSKNDSVKEWYIKEYPEEEDFVENTDPSITFADIYNDPASVYDLLNDIDSMVRENVFRETAKRFGVNYDNLYYRWVDQKPALNLNEAYNGDINSIRAEYYETENRDAAISNLLDIGEAENEEEAGDIIDDWDEDEDGWKEANGYDEDLDEARDETDDLLRYLKNEEDYEEKIDDDKELLTEFEEEKEVSLERGPNGKWFVYYNKKTSPSSAGPFDSEEEAREMIKKHRPNVKEEDIYRFIYPTDQE